MYAKMKANACESFDTTSLNYGQKKTLIYEMLLYIDRNLNPTDIGNALILPSGYICSPQNMHEFMQDLMTYVRHYGRPD